MVEVEARAPPTACRINAIKSQRMKMYVYRLGFILDHSDPKVSVMCLSVRYMAAELKAGPIIMQHICMSKPVLL